MRWRRVEWFTFALVSMVFIAVANIFLKQIMDTPNPIDMANIWLIIPFLITGVIALGSFLLALRAPQSSVSIVSAVVSLSFVLVAVLAAIFLGEKFSAKELSALFLAAIAVGILVI